MCLCTSSYHKVESISLPLDSGLILSLALASREVQGGGAISDPRLQEAWCGFTCSLGTILLLGKRLQLAYCMIKDVWPSHFICPSHQSAHCLTCEWSHPRPSGSQLTSHVTADTRASPVKITDHWGWSRSAESTSCPIDLWAILSVVLSY